MARFVRIVAQAIVLFAVAMCAGLIQFLPAPASAAATAAVGYRTEWVWLLSVYQDQVRSLAMAVSDKYRKQLNIPDGM